MFALLGSALFGSAAASAATISAGASLVGGALQRRDARKNPPRTDFAALRAGAEQAGFNPLTALQATGGAGFQTGQAPVSMGAVLQNFGNRVGDIVKANDPVKAAKERQEMELMDAQIDALRATAPLARMQQKTTAVEDYKGLLAAQALTDDGQVKPVARPTIDTIARRPVMMPDGQVRQIPADFAERMRIENFGYMSAGEYAEMVGELRGEGEAAIMVSEIGQAVGVPVFGDTPDRDKVQPKVSPFLGYYSKEGMRNYYGPTTAQ